MKRSSAPRQLSFQSKLERIAKRMEYYAVSVPSKVSRSLQTRGQVPVLGRINGSKPFLASLYPVGGGRHYLRIKNKTCKEVEIRAGDRVRVQIKVRDRAAEVSLPKDLMSALRAERVLKEFEALPVGKRSFLLRWVDQAAKPETRKKRIRFLVEEAHRKRERGLDGSRSR